MRRGSLLLGIIALAACQGSVREPISPEIDQNRGERRYTHDYQLFQTKNGLVFAFVPEQRTNLVAVDVRYRVGAAEDPVGKEGLAHFVEHLMFQVRADDSTHTLGARLGAAALVFNAYTNSDETHYTATALQDSLGELLQIEAARMGATCESFDDAHIERERQIVKLEIDERGGPGSELRSALSAAIFPAGHPYARSVIGSKESIDAITRADICEFIANHYGPNRAILVVSGKFDLGALNVFVTVNFGPITKTAVGKRARFKPLALSALHGEHAADLENPAIVLALPSAPWGSSASSAEGLLITLFEARARRLDDEKLGIDSIGSTRLGGWRGGADLLVVGLKKDADAEKVAAALFEQAKRLAERIPEGELDSYRAAFRNSLIERHEPFSGRASNVADYLQYTDHLRFLLKDLEYLDKVSASQLKEMAAAINPKKTYVGRIVQTKNRRKHQATRLADPGKSFDLETWRAPVDPALAEIPLATAIERPPRRLREFELPSGLRVILASDFSYPTIDYRLIFPAGSANDSPDKRGTARLAGLLLEDDTKTLRRLFDKIAYSEIVELGGAISTSVSEDSTTFSIRGMSYFADAYLWQLYFRVYSGAYDGDTFKRVMKKLRRVDSEDEDDESDMIRSALFGSSHPYALNLTAESLLRVSRDDLERFRDRYYRPSGATLIVAGRFDTLTMKKRLVRLFGPWDWKIKPVENSLLAIPPAPDRPSAQAFLVKSDRSQPQITIAYALNQAASTTAHRLVLRELLAQRLAAIRERLGASYGLRVSLTQARGPWLLTIHGEIEAARAVEALLAIRSEIEVVRAGGSATAADFVRARRRVLEGILADSASAGSTADELEIIAMQDLGDDYFTALATGVASLVSSELTAVAADQLAPNRVVTVLRGPNQTIVSMAKGAGLTNVVSVTKK